MADERGSRLKKWILLGTGFQLLMVLGGHWVAAVAHAFGVLGTGISLVFGGLYGRWAPTVADAALGGAVVGGSCALIGAVVSWLLGDVVAVIMAVATISGVVSGLIGGVVLRLMTGPAPGTEEGSR